MSDPPPPYPGKPLEKTAPPYEMPPQTGYGAPSQQALYGAPPQQYGAPPQSYGAPHQPYGAPPQSYGAPAQPGYPQTAQPGSYGFQQPPQAGFNPQPDAYNHQTTVVVSQPPVRLVQSFLSTPVRTTCPHCRAEIVTATHFESGSFSWVMCVILCILGCDFGCCLIPFCVEGCQDVMHTCPNCHQHISRWSRL